MPHTGLVAMTLSEPLIFLAGIPTSLQRRAHGVNSSPLATVQGTLPELNQRFPLRQHPGLLRIPQPCSSFPFAFLDIINIIFYRLALVLPLT